MIRTRHDLEQLEHRFLADYALKSDDAYATSRVYSEPSDENRTAFQRDADRIFHTKAFRRLKGKTQVVLAEHGDHFRTRLIHTMNVANVATDISRRLALNEDLCLAISYGHDLGHTCFGHEGEAALNEQLKDYNAHFEHNEQSLHLVEHLEPLNLTRAVRDGLDKHRTVYDHPESRDSVMPSLEAQVVNYADEIAYRFHDLDDGLRAGVFATEDLHFLQIWQRSLSSLDDKDASIPRKVMSKLLELMIGDVANTTDSSLRTADIHSPQDASRFQTSLVAYSPQMLIELKELSDFLFNRFYKSQKVREYNLQGRKIITFLFNWFYNNPALLPSEFAERLASEPQHFVVKDYVAGMTDAYATSLYKKYFS